MKRTINIQIHIVKSYFRIVFFEFGINLNYFCLKIIIMIKYLLSITLIINLFFSVKLSAQTGQEGFYLDNWLPKTIEIKAYDTVETTNLAATVNITVNAGSTLSKVSPYIYGHNAAAWGGKLNQNTMAVKVIKDLRPNVVRWPGGSMSNEYFWKATSRATSPRDVPPGYNYKDLLYGSNNSSWTMSVDNFYDLLVKTNSTGSISINYSYARLGTGPDPVRTAAKYAADWVRYDKGRTKFWEIGNENMGSWELGYEIDTNFNKDGQPKIISGDLYGRHCRIFIEEMRKAAIEVGSDIKIGVVTMDSHVTYNTVMMNWNKGMMPHIADVADFLVVHSYFTPYDQNSDVATILNSPPKTNTIKQYVNNGMKTHANSSPLPLALTEWNIFATGSGQAVSFVNGMHATLVLGELIKNSYGQANRWDFVNGWGNGNNHGLLADGEPGINRYTPRAPYFYMYYFQKFFGDRMVQSSVTGNSYVVSYASRFYTGEAGIVLVNKSASEQVASVRLEMFKKGARYYYYVLTGGSDNGNFSRKVYVNGYTTTLAGGGPSDYDAIKPFGDTIGEEIKVKLPGLSVVYLLVESDSSLQTQNIQFDPLPSMKMDDESIQVSATASSGLPVDFATSDASVAVVKNGIITVTGAGTCDIIALQQGDTIYAPASPVAQKLVVEKADQHIQFPEIPVKVTGETDFIPGAVASSDLPCTYTSSNHSVATIVNGMIRIIGAGTSVITARQSGNKNYSPAGEVSQTLHVTQATTMRSIEVADDFIVYPNPAAGMVTIHLNTENTGLTIINSLGIPVSYINGSGHEFTISTSSIGGAGIYFVRFNSVVKKFTVIR